MGQWHCQAGWPFPVLITLSLYCHQQILICCHADSEYACKLSPDTHLEPPIFQYTDEGTNYLTTQTMCQIYKLMKLLEGLVDLMACLYHCS